MDASTQSVDSSLESLRPRFAAAVRQLLAYAAAEDLRPVVVETFRSVQRQNDLYRQGRTAPGSHVTDAKGGQSPHQYGLAADVVSAFGERSPQQKRLREIGRIMGFGLLSWDLPHFEHPRWREVFHRF